MNTTLILIGLVCFFSGLLLTLAVYTAAQRSKDKKKLSETDKEADRILHRAKSKAAKVDRESKNRAKDFENRSRRNTETATKKEKQKLNSLEQSYKDKMERLDRDHKEKSDDCDTQLAELTDREEKMRIAETRIHTLEKDVSQNILNLQKKLEEVAELSKDEARKKLVDALQDEARKEAADSLTQIENEVKAESQARARHVLSKAISRYASEVATERTVTSLPLSGEEMKGKIIGREGRNIRALEGACGVDVIIDETPDSVIISSFDPIRRQVGKQVIERLMEDGRVHPARIEEVAAKVKRDLDNSLEEEGEKACFDLGVHGVSAVILKVLGSLKYRQNGTQNVLEHCVEVGYMAGLMAAEIGADEKAARRAGLLHDLGRGIDHTVEGDHATVGADFAKKNGEKDFIVDAIRFHEKEEGPSLLCHLVQAANNLSKARPGARRSQMEGFINRLEDLESVGNSFDGVERTFALQSGKEVRVIVDSSKVTDKQAQMLSRDIAKKVERELNYPGQIKVAVVRETRIVEHAR